MRGGTRDERPPLLGTESACHALRRRQPAQPEAGGRQRMGRDRAHGAEEGGEDLVHVPDEGGEEARVGESVRPERVGDLGHALADAYRPAPFEGMREGDGRREQPDIVGGQVDVGEGGGCQQQRVDRGADVVAVPGQGELRRAAAPSGLVGSFEDVDGQAGAGQGEGGDQPVGPGSHHNGVGLPHRRECRPFLGSQHRYGAVGEARQGLFDLRVGAVGSMVEQHHELCAGGSAEPDGVFGRRVAEGSLGRHFLRTEVSVVDQHIDVARQLERRRVVLPDASGPVAERSRAVVGDVGDGRTAVGHPEPESAATLVRNLQGRDDESLRVEGAEGDEAEPPVSAQFARFDREERRRHHAGQHGLGVGVVVLDRHQERHPCAVAVASGEERQSLHVIPVQVREQQGALERMVTEDLGQPAQARAAVEQEAAARSPSCDNATHEVLPAEADEVGPWGGRRPPHPAEGDAHRLSLARGPRGDAPRTAPPDASDR